MFYCYDLYTGKYVTLENERELVFFWRRKFGKNFDQLNVTGSDTFATQETTGRLIPVKDYFIQETIIKYYTRQYMVIDEYGRHIDVRLMDKKLWEMPMPEQRRRWYWFSRRGFKHHGHRHNGPSLRKRHMLANSEDPMLDMDELYPDLNRPVKNHTGVRTKTNISWDDVDYYHEHMYSHGYYESRCWKDQRKNRHQYNRHNRAKQRVPDKRDIHEELTEDITDNDLDI